jgi:MFS family permease
MNSEESRGMPSKRRITVGPGAWWLLAVLWLLYSLSFVHKYTIAMLVDPIKAELALSDFQMSIILGPAFSICYALSTLPFGWTADRHPNVRRSLAAGGSILCSIATIAIAFAQSFAAMLGGRVAVGISEAAVSPTAYSLIADRFPRERLTTATSIFQTAIKAGQATAFALTGILLASLPIITVAGVDLAPWRTIMILFALPGLVLGLLLYTCRSPQRAVEPSGPGVETATLRSFVMENRSVLTKFAIGFLLADLCSAALISWTPTYVGRRFDLSPAHYGPIIGVLSIAAAVILVLKGVVTDWLYARGMKDAHIRFYCWLLAASLPFGFSIYFVTSPTLFFGMYAVLQLVMISFASFATASISNLAPANLRGRLIAIFLLMINIVGGGLGPLIIGALTDFVFQDKMKIGMSLAVLLSTAMPGALFFLWWCLKGWREALERSEARAAVAQATA